MTLKGNAMGESRLDRSQRYWRYAAEAFHCSSATKNSDMRGAYVRIAMSWAALADELEKAEAASSWGTGQLSPPLDPVRHRPH